MKFLSVLINYYFSYSRGENTPGSAKIRYIRGCREPKTLARYTSSLKNMIPLRSFNK